MQVENNRNTLEGNQNLIKENVKSTDLQNLQYWRIIKQMMMTIIIIKCIRANLCGLRSRLDPDHP